MSTTAVTVLGSCGGFPEPARACSGFLVERDGYRVLLDLGYGALRGLLEARPDGMPDAIVVSHEHPDHCADLHPLFRLLHYGRRGSARIPLYCPPGVLDRLSGLEPDVDLEAVYDERRLPGSYELGPFRLSSWELPHFVTNVGVRLQASDVVIAYTGDTAPVPELADLGRDADLFIVEATDRPDETAATTRNLMTAAEAGRAARTARAKRLMLTHFWPGNDRQRAAAAAREEFAGEVVVAEEGLTLSV